MKLSIDPLVDIKYDYLTENEGISKLQRAHSIYAKTIETSDWKDQVYFAKEEIRLSLDLLLKAQKEEIRLTEAVYSKKDFDLKRLLYVKEDDLSKIISKFSLKLCELELQLQKQEKWRLKVQEIKKRNWVIEKIQWFYLDFGFKKSNLII